MKLEQELYKILEPLSSVDGVMEVLEELGFALPGLKDLLPPEMTDFIADADQLVSEIRALADALASVTEAAELVPEALRLFQMVRDGFEMVQNLRTVVTTADLPALPMPFSEPEFWQGLAEALPGYLLKRWVRDHHALAYEVVDFLKLWQAAGQGFDLEQLNRYFSEPLPSLLALVMDDTEIDLDDLVTFVLRVVSLLGLERQTQSYYAVDGITVARADQERPEGLFNGFLRPPGVAQLGGVSLKLDYLDGKIVLGADLAGDVSQDLPLSPDWRLRAQARGAASIDFLFSPQDGIELDPDQPSAAGQLALLGQPQDPWRIFGFDRGPQLSLASFAIEAGLTLDSNQPEFTARIGFEDLKLSVDMGDGDSFVADAIPMDAFDVSFSAALSWSSLSGLSLTSGGPSVIQIPVNLNIGPISIPTVTLEFSPMEEAFGLSMAVSAAVDLGFMKIAVNEVGAQTEFRRAADGQGVLGDFDLSVGFKPPTGLGLAIGVPNGPISGGGYLNVDHAAGRYEGILDLQVIKVGISAIVIIDTKALDDGAWSMFFALFIELPSIQLGFGISLDGVGGVAGIHRTLDPEALLAAARSGAIDTVLFPENPIADAPIIIDTFRTLFPPARGRYVFGPMIKLGWAKGMVSAEMGVVIELPDPILVAVMGSIKIIIPKPPAQQQPTTDGPEEEVEPAILALRLDLAGVFDFEEGTIAVDAFLHDSAIAGFPIAGGMSLRAGFKNNPKFLMALGGFHPGFAQPPNFPEVPRLSMGIEIAGIIEISLESYFAITSNTVQFGAAMHLLADIGIFAIEGGFEFDALFEFNPFHMDIALSMYVSVEALGIDLMAISLVGTAVGPKPWVITAVAEFSVIGYRNGVEINYGTGETAVLPAVVPPGLFELLIEELSLAQAWDVVGGAAAAGVMLAAPDPQDASPGIAPNATIAVAQKLVPLQTIVDRFGRNTAVQHTRFELQLDVPEDAVIGDLEEWFAPGRFRDLGTSDQAQLSAPSFEEMPAGKTITGGLRMGAVSATAVSHKVSRVDPEWDVDPAMFPAPAQTTAEDIIGSERLNAMLTSDVEALEFITGVETVEVVDIGYQPVNVTDGGAGSSGSFMAATAAFNPDTDALIRTFEREPI